MASKQANFLLPEELLKELHNEVPRGKQSEVVAEALRKELKRLKFRKAINATFGVWKSQNHPELQNGTAKCIRTLRKSNRGKHNK